MANAKPNPAPRPTPPPVKPVPLSVFIPENRGDTTGRNRK